MPSGRTIAVNTLVSAVATIIALLTLEIAVRIFNLAPLSEVSLSDGGLKSILEFDPILETRYRPESQTRIVSPYGEFDVSYHINNLGLRDAELTKKPQAEFRILVAGNSFVEGWGVNEDDEFVRVAERVANAQQIAAGAKHLRLVNAGISAYGAAQSYLQAKEIWTVVDPDMVILVLVGTMVNSDFEFLKQARLDSNGIAQGLSADAVLSGGTPIARENNSTPLILTSLARYSAIVRLITERMANRRAMDRIHIGDPETDMLAAYRSGADLLKQMYEPTLHHVGALAQLSREFGTPFRLVHLPMAFQVSASSWDEGRKAYRLEPRIYDSDEEAMVKDFCNAHAMDCLFADDLIKTDAQRSEGAPLYFRYDFHFTTTGNRLIGNWLGHELGRSLSTLPNPPDHH